MLYFEYDINTIWMKRASWLFWYLLFSGAQCDKQDRHGNTALLDAAANSQKEVVKVLLRYHANPDIPCTKGSTPLLGSNLFLLSSVIPNACQSVNDLVVDKLPFTLNQCGSQCTILQSSIPASKKLSSSTPSFSFFLLCHVI